MMVFAYIAFTNCTANAKKGTAIVYSTANKRA